ncbi:hypothetical protein B1757_02585 [Acidithiobacillus marinus]|uniref:Uncharacterized protein n=1 Tax=Acidithiobacillus marinus TaxID=187490 RepID=A0A2I1DPQ1_9PROT|nr:hypothetical protein [Acidithiobacillus marinus]PKY11865.1 hypothetical protein B1757_02585 [Acidithiobacillus marinus]
MFGFGEHQENITATCPCCLAGGSQTQMQDMGAHGIRMGGLTGIGGAALGMLGGQMADDGEEAFEKKLKVQVFVCPQCHEVSFKYRGGL